MAVCCAAFALKQGGAGGGKGMGISERCLSSVPGSAWAQHRVVLLSSTKARASTGEDLLPELCSLLNAAAHQLSPTVHLAHSFGMWRRSPRDTAPELEISVSGEQGLLVNT